MKDFEKTEKIDIIKSSMGNGKSYKILKNFRIKKKEEREIKKVG